MLSLVLLLASVPAEASSVLEGYGGVVFEAITLQDERWLSAERSNRLPLFMGH